MARLILFACLVLTCLTSPLAALTLRICNEGYETFDVLLAGNYGRGMSSDYVTGWYPVRPGDCFTETGYGQSTYHFAIAYEDRAGNYGILPYSGQQERFEYQYFQTSNRKVCVVPGQKFERQGTMRALSRCRDNEVLVPINIFTTGLDLSTHTLRVKVTKNTLHREAMLVERASSPKELAEDCKAGDAAACMDLGVKLKRFGIKEGDERMLRLAATTLMQACRADQEGACREVRKLVSTRKTPDDLADWISSELLDICFNEVPSACMQAAFARRIFVRRADDKTLQPEDFLYPLLEGCRHDEVYACLEAGKAYEKGRDAVQSLTKAFDYYRYTCALTLPPNDPLPEPTKVTVTIACYRGAKLAESGEGLEKGKDLKLARAMYAVTCRRGATKAKEACKKARALAK